MNTAILVAIGITLLVYSSESCNIIPSSTSSLPSNMELGLPYRDNTNYVRKLYTGDKECECGKDDNSQGKPWYVHIHAQISNTAIRTCTGTVISSNMAVTSHQCFALEGKKMQAYEAWSSIPERVHTVVENVSVSIHDDPSIESDYFGHYTVKEIIYHTLYAPLAPLEKDAASEYDIAVVVINENFFSVDDNSELGRIPACIPNANIGDPPLNVHHRLVYYYGFGAELPMDKTLADRFVNEMVVLTGPECDKEQNFGDYSRKESLCIRYRAPPPTLPGGPLMTTNEYGLFNNTYAVEYEHTSYLLGISSTAIKKPPKKSLTYTYFGNVLKNIKYLEKIANINNSSWCTTPHFDQTKGKAKAEDAKLQHWEWEQIDGHNKYAAARDHDSTLDCSCGIKNSDVGRIVNGETAIPYEFGWQVRLYIDDGYLCGGSIVNDRVIITAAHCVLRYEHEDDDENRPFHFVPIQNITAFVRSHFTRSDPIAETLNVARIIIHPGYRDSLPSFVYDSDIALLILETTLQFEKHFNKSLQIRPICIPTVDQGLDLTVKNDLYSQVTVAGWGIVNPWDPPEKRKAAKQLQKITLPLQALEKCAAETIVRVTTNMICAGTFNQSQDSSQGDSGGSLFVGQRTKGRVRQLQVGVVSFGATIVDSAADDNGYEDMMVGFYTNLQKFIPFVDYYSRKYGAKWCKH